LCGGGGGGGYFVWLLVLWVLIPDRFSCKLEVCEFVSGLSEAPSPWGRGVRAVPRLRVVYPGICLVTEEKSRKNLRQRDENFGVIIREMVWLENSLSQSEEGVTGKGCVRVEKPGVEVKDPNAKSRGINERKKRRCVGVRKGSHRMIRTKILCFRWPSPFFERVQNGFPGVLLPANCLFLV